MLRHVSQLKNNAKFVDLRRLRKNKNSSLKQNNNSSMNIDLENEFQSNLSIVSSDALQSTKKSQGNTQMGARND